MSPIDLSYLHDPETRVTDHATGGQKGAKLCQIGALDPIVQIELGRVAGMGANKYARFNYLRGFDWSLAYDAMQRHANLFWAGEDRDPESGLPHIAHANWMSGALLSFYLRGLGTDDRPPRLSAPPDEKTMTLLQYWDKLEKMGIPTSSETKLRALGIDSPDTGDEHP